MRLAEQRVPQLCHDRGAMIDPFLVGPFVPLSAAEKARLSVLRDEIASSFLVLAEVWVQILSRQKELNALLIRENAL